MRWNRQKMAGSGYVIVIGIGFGIGYRQVYWSHGCLSRGWSINFWGDDFLRGGWRLKTAPGVPKGTRSLPSRAKTNTERFDRCSCSQTPDRVQEEARQVFTCRASCAEGNAGPTPPAWIPDRVWRALQYAPHPAPLPTRRPTLQVGLRLCADLRAGERPAAV